MNNTSNCFNCHSLQNISELPAHSRKRPPYSYVALILMAISQSPEQKLPVSGIYDYINQFPYYKQRYPKWMNSVRYTLSQNDCFVKIPRELDSRGRGYYWTLDPEAKDMFDDGSFLRRRKRYKRLSSYDYHQHPPYPIFSKTDMPKLIQNNEVCVEHFMDIKTEPQDEIKSVKPVPINGNLINQQEPKHCMVSFYNRHSLIVQ